VSRLKIALIVPGGVDRSGEYRVIPALVALIRRLASAADLHVFALAQQRRAESWDLADARVHNAGRPFSTVRTLRAIRREHSAAPFDVLQSVFSGRCGLIAALASRWLRVPYAVHVAGGELVDIRDIGYGGAAHWYWRRLEAWQLRGAARVTAASEPMREALARLEVAALRLPLGADRDAWPPREPVARAPEEVARLVHVASLNKVKDQPTLLRALALLAARGRRFRLDVVGEDTLHGEIQALARQLALEPFVHFHGFLTQSAAQPIVAAAHLNLVTSRHEAGPLVVLESALCGVPTVGTCVGHIAEWAPRAASAVRVRDPEALAQAIETLLDDEPQRQALAHAARQRAVAEDADYTAREFLRMHTDLAAS